MNQLQLWNNDVWQLKIDLATLHYWNTINATAYVYWALVNLLTLCAISKPWLR